MSTSRILGILAFGAQVLNGALGVAAVYRPQYVAVIAGLIGAIQAFTARVQGSTATAKGE